MREVRRLEEEVRQLRREVDLLRSVGGVTRLRGPLDAGGHRIFNVGDPVESQDALTAAGTGGTSSGGFSFLTVNSHPLLIGSRQVTAGTNVTVTDGGAGSTITFTVSGLGGYDETDFLGFTWFMS